MKKLIKTLAVIAAAATLAFGFASCSSSGSDDTPTVVPGTGTGTGTTTTPTNTTPTNTTPTTTPTVTPAAGQSADFAGTIMGMDMVIHFKADGSYVTDRMGSPKYRGTYTLTGDFTNGTVKLHQT